MANKSISQLTAGGAIASTDLFPDVQTAGVGPVKVTALQLGTYVLTGVFDTGFTFNTTTKSLTLGVQSTTAGSLVLANANASAYATTVKSSDSASAAWTLTLPVSAGTNGYLLTTNGSGVTAWTNPTALGIDLDIGTTVITGGTTGRVLYDNAGVLGEYSITGTAGSVVLSTGPTFTSSITLGTQQTTQGSIVLANTAAGAFATTLQASNSASAAWTLTLPTTAGTNGYLLTTNGSGVTSWTNPTSLGIDLDVGTTAITNGTTTHILYDNAGVLGEYTVTGTGTTAVLSTSPTFTTSIIDPLVVGGTGTTSTLTLRSTSGVGTTGADIIFQTGNNGATEAMRILNDGKVGIGISSPSAVLNPAAPTQTDNTKSALFVSDSSTTTKGVAIGYDASANYGHIQAVNKGVAYTNLGLQVEGGNVGIGTSTPGSKLSVYSAATNPMAVYMDNNYYVAYSANQNSSQIGFSLNLKNASGTSQVGYVTATGGTSPYMTFIAPGSSNGYLTFGNNNGSGGLNEYMRIDSSGNLLLGGTAARGTTVGAAHLDIFNGTAPAGTLTNGISLYSSSGDFNFMDSSGNGYKVGFRNVPPVGTKTSSYQLATADVGKYVQVSTGGAITIPDATFAEGDIISIFNNTTGNITITCSITTAYIAGTDTDKATMTLATRGVATVLFISSTVCVVSGNVS